MNQTQQITIADTNGQSTTYVPKPEVEIPEDWTRALKFAEMVREKLATVSTDDFPALVNLVMHLTR